MVLIDQKIDQFGENVQAQNEARPFVEPFDPIGTNPVNSFNSPFGRHEGQ
ncbi:head completion-like protein [Aeromonas phage phiAS4]|uniref:Head completion-like protein n=1 Tax=Aeromonas phage phiAS4 TaxID=879628 RepID=E1A1G7_9CAUD|nr:head completion-like protein [Aeromonas phage phiAS4]ADM79691.1 head completion-like protein [Aeromonas phage phiAS4]